MIKSNKKLRLNNNISKRIYLQNYVGIFSIFGICGIKHNRRRKIKILTHILIRIIYEDLFITFLKTIIIIKF